MAKHDQSAGDTRVDPRAGEERVARTLRGAGHPAYVVGGCLRGRAVLTDRLRPANENRPADAPGARDVRHPVGY